jgi:hypothetical protein
VKVLFRTDKVRTTSTGMPDGQPHAVEAWFEFQVHEGPPDPKTWEGCGQTAAYWWDQSKRLKDPTRWAFRCHDVAADLEAVIPDVLVRSLPPETRISFVWTVCQV